MQLYQYKYYNNNNVFIQAILSPIELNKINLNNIAIKYNIDYNYIIESITAKIITK